jgi:Cu/Ag efflux pump CusA
MGVGALLVTLVLVAFLRRPRLAIISLAAIPLSLLAAAAVLTLMGASIDGMTLGGLAIAVGEVVDDAIVDVENVWRRLRANARLPEPRDALEVVHDASREVRGSVVYATIIVVIVLLPVLMLGGVAGRIFSPLALAYMMSITASLFVALTVTPALCAVLLPRVATAEEEHSALATWVSSRYARLLRRVVEHPRVVLGSAVALAAVALAVLPFLGGGFLPSFRERTLVAHLNAAPGISLDESMRLAGAVGHELSPDVAVHFAARAGRAPLDEDAAPVSRIEADLVLSAGEEADAEHGEMLEEVAERVEHIPGLGVSVEDFLGERIHEVLSGETAPLVVRISGPDLDTLRRIARRVASLLSTIEGVDGVHVEPQIDVAQVRVVPRRDAMALAGVRAADLAEAAAAWEQGIVVAQAQGQGGRVVDITLAGVPRDLGTLGDMPIAGLAGVTLPLGSLADIRDVPAPAWIQHQAGERRITVGASLASGAASHVTDEVARRLHEIETPSGYHLDLAGDAIARSEAGVRLVVVGALVLLAILVLLAVAFSSMRDAAIVLANVPLGLVGGVAAAALSPEGVSVAGFVGFVTLFGIIARNGIMLVAHTRHLDVEAPELAPVERVLRAAEDRLVPIVMTAATAGLGLLPLAFALWGPAGSELEAPMARIVCGGLLTSTVLNMLVLPTLYVWLARRHS